MRLSLFVFCLASTLMCSCGHDESTPFEGGLSVGYVPPQCNSSKTQSFVMLEKEDRGTHFHTKGAGCITKSIRSLWAVSQNAKTFFWNESKLKNFFLFEESKNEFKFKGEYEGGFKPFTQAWTIEYLHTLDKGSFADPQKITIHFKKVFGTSHIKHWQGIIVLEKAGDNLTEFAMLNEIKATRTDMAKAEGAVRDTFMRLSSESPNWDHLNLR